MSSEERKRLSLSSKTKNKRQSPEPITESKTSQVKPEVVSESVVPESNPEVKAPGQRLSLSKSKKKERSLLFVRRGLLNLKFPILSLRLMN